MTRLARRLTVACLAALAGLPVAASAQDSHFGVRGPGTPGQAASARARATGNAFAPFDALSPLTDAAFADLRRLTASAVGMSSFRRVELGGDAADVRATRFPSLVVGGPIGPHLVVGTGFSSYLDKTFAVVRRDSVAIRGAVEPYAERLASDGAVSDVRLTAAWRFSPRFAVGGSFHLLAGVSRGTVTRQFDDSAAFLTSFELSDVQHTGSGVSGGALLDVTGGLRLAMWFRSDSRLTVSVNDAVTGRYDLPTGIGGGVRVTFSPDLRLAGSVTSRTWVDAGGRNTLEWAVGLEGGAPRFPARLGVRSAQVPFGPAATDPRELALAAGFGRVFSEGRARIDLALERLQRKGGDVRETVWSLIVGLTVQP